MLIKEKYSSKSCETGDYTRLQLTKIVNILLSLELCTRYVSAAAANISLLWLGTCSKNHRRKWNCYRNLKQCTRLVSTGRSANSDSELYECLWIYSSEVLLIGICRIGPFVCPYWIWMKLFISLFFFFTQRSTITKYCCWYGNTNSDPFALHKHGSRLSNESQGWGRGWHYRHQFVLLGAPPSFR